jgi:hypothetical protein
VLRSCLLPSAERMIAKALTDRAAAAAAVAAAAAAAAVAAAQTAAHGTSQPPRCTGEEVTLYTALLALPLQCTLLL